MFSQCEQLQQQKLCTNIAASYRILISCWVFVEANAMVANWNTVLNIPYGTCNHWYRMHGSIYWSDILFLSIFLALIEMMPTKMVSPYFFIIFYTFIRKQTQTHRNSSNRKTTWRETAIFMPNLIETLSSMNPQYLCDKLNFILFTISLKKM